MIKKIFWKTCRFCGEAIEQKAKGRTRTTCSDACRSKLSRIRKGKGIREFQQAEKRVKQRRAVPFGERSFDQRLARPRRELSLYESLYECLACGQPYIRSRRYGGKASPFCSRRCREKAQYTFGLFQKAAYRADVQGTLQEGVKVRLRYGKLSPLCPQCRKPFVPNTTLWGTKKRGRPRVYCSDRCRKEAYEDRWKAQRSGRARIHRYRLCTACGLRFDRSDRLGKRVRRFCSRICAERDKERRKREAEKGKPPRRHRRNRSTWPSQHVEKGIRVNVGEKRRAGGLTGRHSKG